MIRWLNRYFEIESRGSTLRRELLAGTTTWVTLAYIVLVNPVVLGAAGMDAGAVMMATCVGAALATAAAGIFARLPVALAPGMGLNFFFAFTLCGAAASGGFGLTWQQALAATFIAGVLFLASSIFKLRSKLVEVVPAPLRHGIVAGIGLMIAVIGLRWAGLVVAAPGMYIGPGDLGERPVQVATAGLLVTAVLIARRVPGALLLGAGVSAALAAAFGLTTFTGVVAMPPSLLPTFLALDFGGLFAAPTWVLAVVMLLLVDMFDTVGTLIGVASRAGLMDRGRLPRAEAAFAADASGTMVGGLLGTSTITTYIESAAGIAAGGRTGITAPHHCGVAALLIVLLSAVVGRRRRAVRGRRDPLPRSRADSDPDRDLHVSADRQGALGPAALGDPRLFRGGGHAADHQHFDRDRRRIHRLVGAPSPVRQGTGGLGLEPPPGGGVPDPVPPGVGKPGDFGRRFPAEGGFSSARVPAATRTLPRRRGGPGR